ncbi:glycoside hydrolase family 88 protein [Terrimonas sp. NA20]|uniref:Glycoside hydrolase family 88 protein n=1 Tax=Terrimonas ginsenosidimutans TaxID=2908004 RepID=A0ABS9KXI7_9BACT|nr:glycoside hydrolase family 88 protein [Terrimonas ginsenosidimutans]MCG2616952.1 glycoside hydrolase family 88 protein [Terrimonas ginsenosidimutans]
MMKRFFGAVAVLCIVLMAFRKSNNEEAFIQQNLQFAGRQINLMLKDVKGDSVFPRTTNAEGKLVATNMYDWTPGFFPGSLWYSYEFSKDPAMKAQAIRWTEKLEPLKDFTEHHDLGFMMYCSFGNAYRLTGDTRYKDYLVQAAKSLSTRFDKRVGCIKSWNAFKSWHGQQMYYFPVIIDNMMNLELLFFATKVTGDSSYYRTAITHADNTLKNQFRKDYSSYHVICYDTITGKVLAKETAQGYADNSTWARGQAWAIYGYTMTYRETKDPKYLKAAMGMADWYLKSKQLPADMVPFWDFNIKQNGYTPGERSFATKSELNFRDASAAAITASGLLELSEYAGKKGKAYKNAAVKMLHSLASPSYKAAEGENGNFLLKHSVGSIPHQVEIDVPLVYADYYFIEALQRYDRLVKGERLF